MDAGAAAAWLVIVPLAGAAAAAALGRRAAGPVAIAVCTAVPLLAARVAVSVWTDGPQRHRVGGWGAPLGIELVVDGLAAVFLVLTAVVGVATSLYAAAYFRERGARAFWPLWLFVWAGLNGVFVADDLFNMYVTLELVGLGAVALVALAGTRPGSVAAMRYLVVSMAGSLLFLLAVALLYAATGTLSLSVMATAGVPGPTLAAALAAATVGMLLKTAVFPLHAWLPPAHASAPAPASALLSGLVVKASFVVLLRLWLRLATTGDVSPGGASGVAAGEAAAGWVAEAAPQLLGVLGAGAVLWGSALALRQRRAKRLVAYSTVAQIGYLLLLFPLLADGGGGWSTAAWHGGVYHALSHGVAKAAMFLAVGTMAVAVGDDRVRALGGLAYRMPVTFTAFGLAGLSVAGLPPSGGFLAKWLFVHAALTTGRWWWAIVIVAGSLMAAGYVFLVLRCAFERAGAGDPELKRAEKEERTPERLVPLRLEWPALALALVAVAMGLWASGPLRLLGAVPLAGLP